MLRAAPRRPLPTLRPRRPLHGVHRETGLQAVPTLPPAHRTRRQNQAGRCRGLPSPHRRTQHHPPETQHEQVAVQQQDRGPRPSHRQNGRRRSHGEGHCVLAVPHHDRPCRVAPQAGWSPGCETARIHALDRAAERPRRLQVQTRDQGHPDEPQNWRRRTEPAGGELCVSARAVVEPGRRNASGAPSLSHWPAQTCLRNTFHHKRLHRGENVPAPAEETTRLRGNCRCQTRRPFQADPGRSRFPLSLLSGGVWGGDARSPLFLFFRFIRTSLCL
mmetsp:Transcript_29054/g.84841  ORF Transcript_29054/g.84841 Transcript_29054/m.84841 type:complete len:274 (+) Transcript_29054:336-1157(+)